MLVLGLVLDGRDMSELHAVDYLTLSLQNSARNLPRPCRKLREKNHIPSLTPSPTLHPPTPSLLTHRR